ncbi:MAG: hypothetical protein HYR56_19735 [Acidobacteria bacterium]|nr:hypothetical protein [Acidobacteriota bacterium]MBI3422056.1 hypothetical protein [Acidobacteriota bacterium]
MQRKLMFFAFTLAAVCLALGGLAQSQAQQRNGQSTANTGAAAQNSPYKLSGPFTHKNLSVFLVHGANQAGQTGGKTYLTLQEAMRQKKVVVRETGDVNELTIQNRSTEEVFVQAGDIVKGGQQDRVLALDLILPPKSGRIQIDAFCVEHSRWSQRGREAVTAFSASDKMLATKGLKLAARNSQSQSEVWENVSVAQAKLAKNYVAAKGVPGGVAGGRAMGAGGGSASGFRAGQFAPPPATPVPPMNAAERGQNTVRISQGVLSAPSASLMLAEQSGLTAVVSQASPTSLQLTLENKNVKESSADYVNQLAAIIAGKPDVTGYVFAINGQLNSADVYASNALFKKLWPKLLEASAVEAFAEFDESGKFEPVRTDLAQAFFRDAESGKAEVKTLRPRTRMVKHESEKNVVFEVRDRARNDAWVHRNYLAK